MDIPDNAFDVYDLAALAYLYKRVKETEVISEAHHIVIDEAQDFGMMVYAVLKYCIKDCTYTIMGDVSQNIHFGYGLNDWEELKAMYIREAGDGFGILKKSYRNTVEISQFATNVLHHGNFAVYPVEPIIRHGEEPVVRNVRVREDIYRKAALILKKWQEKGLETLAVICRNEHDAGIVATELGRFIEVRGNDLQTAEFGSGVMILPVDYTKGLDFDAVLILDPTRDDYPTDDGHAKLLYVAATRALHELCVLYSGDLTGLIADPISEERIRIIGAEPENAQKKNEEQSGTRVAGGFRRKTAIEDVEDDDKFELLKKKKRVVIVAQAEEKTPVQKKEVVQTVENSFGSMPDTELLKARGHAKTDQSVRWVMRKPDGLYLQSGYGVLRLSPVREDVLRISFAKEEKALMNTHSSVSLTEPFDRWSYRESPKLLELKTDKLCVQVDKVNGCIYYMTADKRPLLSERTKEPRLIEKTPQGKSLVRWYLDWPKNEYVCALSPGRSEEIGLTGVSRWISQSGTLPFLISEKGYGLVIDNEGAVCGCGISGYGTHLIMEDTQVLDAYFVVGEGRKKLVFVCDNLCKKK